LSHENENLRHENENLKLKSRVAVLELENKNLKQNPGIQHITNIGTVNNNIDKIENNVIINAYGSEDISYIKEIIGPRLILLGVQGEIHLFELIHFSDEHPENKNIKLRDLSHDKIGILRNNKWEIVTSEQLTRDHQDRIYILFKGNMIKRGKPNVSQDEINNLIELATPCSTHREATRKGIIKIIQKYTTTN